MGDDKVVDFKREVPHNQGKVKCHSCGHVWWAVVPAPDPMVFMECPECGCDGGMKQGMVEISDEYVWECDCGCTVFEIYEKHGAFCVNCGQVQRW